MQIVQTKDCVAISKDNQIILICEKLSLTHIDKVPETLFISDSSTPVPQYPVRLWIKIASSIFAINPYPPELFFRKMCKFDGNHSKYPIGQQALQIGRVKYIFYESADSRL